MKRKQFLFAFLVLLCSSFSNRVLAVQPEEITYSVNVQADNTAHEWMEVWVEILQPEAIYVKIGHYAGGTDTAKKRVIAKMAEALGIPLDVLEDMNSLEVMQAFFLNVTPQHLEEISSGSSVVTGVLGQEAGDFHIHVGSAASYYSLDFHLYQ